MQVKYSERCKGLKNIATPQIPLWEEKKQKLEKLEIRKLEFMCPDHNHNIMHKNKQLEWTEY